MFTYDPTAISLRGTVQRMHDMLPAEAAVGDKHGNCVIEVTWEENGLQRTAQVAIDECGSRTPVLICTASAGNDEGTFARTVVETPWNWEPVDMWLHTTIEAARAIHPDELITWKAPAYS